MKEYVINSDLINEWDYTKNNELNIYPEKSTLGVSSYKVWWIGKCGHKWDDTIAHRHKEKRGCPYCSNKRVLKGYNDLATTNPELTKQWHPTKNGDLKPTEITSGSDKRVWWICKKGHAWDSKINNANNNKGCPYCSNNKVLEGYNDLATTNPELAKQWHPTKNGDLKPTEITSGSDKRVWWICKKGHAWDSKICNANNNKGCPYCSNNKVLKGYNDLATTNLELAKQWHPTKNENLKPTDITMSSGKRIWWKCTKKHEWYVSAHSRSNNNSGCPYCANKRVLKGYNDLETTNPELAKQWHPTKNGKLKSTTVTMSSGKRIWWQCNNGHEWYVSINSRNKGNGCPYCANKRVLKGYNDLETINPELAKQWHPTKNGKLKPTTVTAGSTEKVWWLGKCGHEWPAIISSRNKGNGCPYCSNQKSLKGYNDLVTINPELAKQWHSINNGKLKPIDVTAGSNKRVWWKCNNGHEWKVSISTRNSGSGCPICKESKGEKKVSSTLNKYNVNYIPQYKIIECKDKRVLPFDFGISILKNKKMLLIEYDGIQHYKPVQFGGISIEKSIEEYKERVKKDKIKTDYCKSNPNIELLRIPYWEFDNIDKIVLKKLYRLGFI